MEEDQEYDSTSDLEELRSRIDELESKLEDEAGDSPYGAVIGYASGMTLAMILSWSRNGSILWCMAHGLVSWIYVIYFALTRN